MLAAGAVGDVTPALEIASGIMGGTLAATSHTTKAGTRALINTSPEPFSNWGASITEDIMVFGGLWAALNHPVLFLIFLAAFILLAIWILPKIWAVLKTIARTIGGWLGLVDKTSDSESSPNEPALAQQDAPPEQSDTSLSEPSVVEQLERLEALKASGALNDTEFEAAKKQLLN